VLTLDGSEAAHLLWAAWRAKQVMRNKDTRRAVGRHVARFILVGLYTGTRSSAICGAALMPTIGRGHIDLEQGLFYRRAIGRRQTKKRQPPVKLPTRLLAHLRRWERLGFARKTLVEWNGKPVESVRKGFETAVRAAGLSAEVTPHILRHTCATWLMQSGVNLWEAGLPPEKWSSLMYGLWPDGGLKNGKEATHCGRDRHEAAAG
jgi:integrase